MTTGAFRGKSALERLRKVPVRLAWLVLAVALAGGATGGEADIIAKLYRATSAGGYDAPDFLPRMKTAFDLSDRSVREEMGAALLEPLPASGLVSIALVVRANGPYGVLWALGVLLDDRPAVRGNTLHVLKFAPYREALAAMVKMLDDKRTAPIYRGPLFEPVLRDDQCFRICDEALHLLLWCLGRENIAAGAEKARLDVQYSDTTEVRDTKIKAFKAWWVAEGKGSVEARLASVVDGIFGGEPQDRGWNGGPISQGPRRK
jgi:hypothetical protein